MPCGSRSAFTLLEIMVVLSILGILGMLIVPRMGSSIAREEVLEAAASFAHTARMTREVAVARQQVFAIEVDGKGYNVQSRSIKDGSFVPVNVSWLRARRWGENVKLQGIRTADGRIVTAGTHKLEFQPDGSSSGASFRLVSGDAECGVMVEPGSGRAAYGDRETLQQSDQQYDLGD